MKALFQLKNDHSTWDSLRLVSPRALITLRNKKPHKFLQSVLPQFQFFKASNCISVDVGIEGLGLMTLVTKANHRYLAKAVTFIICRVFLSIIFLNCITKIAEIFPNYVCYCKLSTQSYSSMSPGLCEVCTLLELLLKHF